MQASIACAPCGPRGPLNSQPAFQPHPIIMSNKADKIIVTVGSIALLADLWRCFPTHHQATYKTQSRLHVGPS